MSFMTIMILAGLVWMLVLIGIWALLAAEGQRIKEEELVQ